jgi:hypothetical protein
LAHLDKEVVGIIRFINYNLLRLEHSFECEFQEEHLMFFVWRLAASRRGTGCPKNEESYFLYLRLQEKYEEISKEI